MQFTIHHINHADPATAAILAEIKNILIKAMSALSDLQTAVANEDTVIASAVTLIKVSGVCIHRAFRYLVGAFINYSHRAIVTFRLSPSALSSALASSFGAVSQLA